MTTHRSVQQLMDLSDRVALITGGAGHIGMAIAQALAECGSRIVLMDVRSDNCENAAATLIEKHKVDALPLAVDLKDSAALRKVPKAVEDKFGRLDVLINCAAMVGTDKRGG